MNGQAQSWAAEFRRQAQVYGTLATLTRPSKAVYDPTAGARNSETEATQPNTYSVKGFFDKEKVEGLPEPVRGTTNANTKSKVFLVADSADVPYNLLVGWKAEIASRTYEVRKVEPHTVQGVNVFYRLELA